MKFYPPILSLDNEFLNIHENSLGKKNNRKYWDFIQHNLINITTNLKGENNYELSLFGIILVLKLIRYCYNNQKEKNLFFGNIPFIEYFEKIVKNYDTKLPLLFGKWNLLKRILKDYAIYNFDKIINEYYFHTDTFSISLGGNNEFFSNIREIILQTRRQYGDFANAGMDCFLICIGGNKPSWPNIKKENESSNYLQTYFPLIDKSNTKKTQYLVSKFFDIIHLLNPVEQIIENPESLYLNQNSYLLNIFENLFAEEISLIIILIFILNMNFFI